MLAATVRLENHAKGTTTAKLIATFYDTNGRILTRPFVVLEIIGNASRPFRFDGPKEAVTVKAYLGEVLQ